MAGKASPVHLMDEGSLRTLMKPRPGISLLIWWTLYLHQDKGLCRNAESKRNSRWEGNPSVTRECRWSALVIKRAPANRKLPSEPWRIYWFCLSTPSSGDPWTFIFLPRLSWIFFFHIGPDLCYVHISLDSTIFWVIYHQSDSFWWCMAPIHHQSSLLCRCTNDMLV